MATKLEILKDINLGQRVAEDEADDLQRYFVETDQWEQLTAGKIDVIYGPKGSGKSALYTSLLRQADAFRKKKILVVSAENPRGATVFKPITTDPPPSEAEFVGLWKLYILQIGASVIREEVSGTGGADVLVSALEEAKLLPTSGTLQQYFRAAKDYVKRWFGRDPTSVEIELSIDPTTGAPTARRKSTYDKTPPVRCERAIDDLPLDDLLSKANAVLERAKRKLWIAFDRLDVAFLDSPDLERNALRALFRAYNDLKSKEYVKLKIFVRDDVWRRITEGGFREASHITKTADIKWTNASLLNLVVLRLIASRKLCKYLGVKADEVRGSYEKQVKTFYRIFPEKVDSGKNPSTFDWIVSRTADGYGTGKPREVIHLVDTSRKEQIAVLEIGGNAPESELLIDRSSIKSALPTVSQVYLEQTLLAEFPELRKYLSALDGQKSTQTAATLAEVWGLGAEETAKVIKKLVDVGVFEKQLTAVTEYRVPFLLRSALRTVQGKAFES